MPNYTRARIIVTNAVRTNLRDLAKAIDFEADGMWIRGLSPTGVAPATRWMANGFVPDRLIQGMLDPVKMYTFAKAKYDADGITFPYTQLQVTNALANCTTLVDFLYDNGTTVVEENPWQTASRLGLQFLTDPPP